jgi:hypothetical protein
MRSSIPIAETASGIGGDNFSVIMTSGINSAHIQEWKGIVQRRSCIPGYLRRSDQFRGDPRSLVIQCESQSVSRDKTPE